MICNCFIDLNIIKEWVVLQDKRQDSPQRRKVRKEKLKFWVKKRKAKGGYHTKPQRTQRKACFNSSAWKSSPACHQSDREFGVGENREITEKEGK